MSYYYKFVSNGEDPLMHELPLRRDLFCFAIKYPDGFILEREYMMYNSGHFVKYWTLLTNAGLVIEINHKTPIFKESKITGQWEEVIL